MYNSITTDVGISMYSVNDSEYFDEKREMGTNQKNDIFIIEINSFGKESQASSELFDWNNDYHILYNSKEPVFKFYDDYKW